MLTLTLTLTLTLALTLTPTPTLAPTPTPEQVAEMGLDLAAGLAAEDLVRGARVRARVRARG